MAVPRFVNLTTGQELLPKGRMPSKPRRRSWPVNRGWAERYVIRLCSACAVQLDVGGALSKPIHGGHCYVCEQRCVVRVFLDPT